MSIIALMDNISLTTILTTELSRSAQVVTNLEKSKSEVYSVVIFVLRLQEILSRRTSFVFGAMPLNGQEVACLYLDKTYQSMEIGQLSWISTLLPVISCRSTAMLSFKIETEISLVIVSGLELVLLLQETLHNHFNPS